MKISNRGLEFIDKPIDRDLSYQYQTDMIKNSKELYDKVKSSGWLQEGSTQKNPKLNKISFKFNSHGFRCFDEFNKDSKGIAFLGCSDTFGWGQHNNKIWTTLVSKHFDKVCWNLGVSGGSMSTSYRVLKSHIDSIDVDYVCMLSPNPFRSETYYQHDNDIRKVFILPNTDFTKYPKFIEESHKRIWSLEENWELEYHKSLDAIKHLCNERGITLIHIENPTHLDYPNEISLNENFSIDFARDGTHAGEYFQKKVSEYFIRKILDN